MKLKSRVEKLQKKIVPFNDDVYVICVDSGEGPKQFKEVNGQLIPVHHIPIDWKSTSDIKVKIIYPDDLKEMDENEVGTQT
jgi:hypothetical protein